MLSIIVNRAFLLNFGIWKPTKPWSFRQYIIPVGQSIASPDYGNANKGIDALVTNVSEINVAVPSPQLPFKIDFVPSPQPTHAPSPANLPANEANLERHEKPGSRVQPLIDVRYLCYTGLWVSWVPCEDPEVGLIRPRDLFAGTKVTVREQS